jgi:hypothetical protein
MSWNDPTLDGGPANASGGGGAKRQKTSQFDPNRKHYPASECCRDAARDNTDCPICADALCQAKEPGKADDEYMIVTLGCNHCFHLTCIQSVIKAAHGRNIQDQMQGVFECPICRNVSIAAKWDVAVCKKAAIGTGDGCYDEDGCAGGCASCGDSTKPCKDGKRCCDQPATKPCCSDAACVAQGGNRCACQFCGESGCWKVGAGPTDKIQQSSKCPRCDRTVACVSCKRMILKDGDKYCNGNACADAVVIDD